MSDNSKTIFRFGVLTSLYWFSLYTYVPTLSTYAQSMGASNKLVGIIVGSYGFTQMLIRIPLGIASDKLNKRKLFVIAGIICSILSSIGMWLFDGPIFLLFFRGLAGAAASAWVAFTVLFSGYFEHDKAPKAIGIINSYNSAGQLAAMIAGGAAVYFIGERAPFIIAFIGGVLGLALYLGIREKPAERREPLKLADLTVLLANKDFLMCSVLAVLSQLITYATVFSFTPVIAKQLGATPLELNILSALSTLPVIFSSALSGSLFSERFGERNTIVAGFLICAISSACIPFVGSLGLLFITQFVGGFGRGMTYSLLMGLSIKTVAAGKRASAMGFFQAVYGIGMTLGPAILGLTGDMLGFTWGFLFVGAVSIAGATLSLLLSNSKKLVKI